MDPNDAMSLQKKRSNLFPNGSTIIKVMLTLKRITLNTSSQ